MAREDLKMNLPKITVDDLFSTQESRDAEKLGKVVNIKIQDIAYKNGADCKKSA